MPVAEFSGRRGWGYDGVDLFAPHHAYGGPEGLKRLVDACHAPRARRGARRRLQPPRPGRQLSRRSSAPTSPTATRPPGATPSTSTGPAATRCGASSIDNALMWLRDYHFDGLRLDAVHAIVDESAIHILEQLAAEVDALAAHVRRPLFLVAESDRNDPRLVRGRDAGGYGLDAVEPTNGIMPCTPTLTGETRRLLRGLRAAAPSWPRRSARPGSTTAPTPRTAGAVTAGPSTGLSGNRFVGVHPEPRPGRQPRRRRARRRPDERRTAAGRRRPAAHLAVRARCSSRARSGAPSTPFQYFTDHEDPELGEAVSDGRRREFAAFGWDPDDVPDPQAPSDVRALQARLDRVSVRTSTPTCWPGTVG